MFAAYNPAKDGFPAKAWECLRRSRALRNDVNCVGAESEDDAIDMAAEFRSKMETHPFYRSVYAPLVEWPHYGHDGDKEGLHYFSRRLEFEMPWPDIHKETQGWIENSLQPQSASVVETPPADEFHPHSKYYKDVKAKGLLSDLSEWLVTHRVIVLPQVVWDKPHKARLLAEVEKLIGDPLAKDARWMKNTGRLLGSEAEWRAFLLVEQWRNPSAGRYGLGMAANLAAWEIYGGEDFGTDPQLRVAAAKDFLGGCGKIQKHAATVERHVRRIEKAIASVYPDFNPTLNSSG